MGKKFRVEIVTPERLVFSEETESLVVPAERGYLGVLAGHAPLLCTLQPGEIRIRGEKGDLRYATSGGFMEVTPQKATLLTESAEEASGIDVARAEKALARAKERLASAERGIDKERAKQALERAQNRLKLASKGQK
jgi:F-type H+-transporting ATPase subunit epsilon